MMITEVHGSGDPLLFVHGLGGTSNVFTPQVAMLSRFFTCIRPDLPGSGRTPALEAFSLVDLADQLAALLDARGQGPAHVVGHSLGTIVCQQLAARRPDLVRSLVLVGPLKEPAPGARQALLDRAAKARSAGMSEIADAVVAGGTSARTRAARPEVVALVREILMRQDSEGYALTCEALSHAVAADVAAVTAPTLLITGDEDGTAPPAAVRSLKNDIAGARLQMLDNCGHWATFERPDAVNAEILNFLFSL